MSAGACFLAGVTRRLILTCIWAASATAWSVGQIVSLIAVDVVLAIALVGSNAGRRPDRAARPAANAAGRGRERRAVPDDGAPCSRSPCSCRCFLQTTTGATPTEAGLLLVPMMLGITLSTNLAGREIAKPGRYKRYPIIGLALMTSRYGCWP